MASQKGDDKSPKKRTIEFDMFVRDLEPDEDETIRGGGKTGDQRHYGGNCKLQCQEFSRV